MRTRDNVGMRRFALAALAFAAASSLYAQGWPQTRAERTNYNETSHYEDVIQFLHDLQLAGAPVSIQVLGKSAEGKDMPLAIASYPPVSSAAEARRLGKPIVYIQANIHAGEVEGKEAALAILRRLSQDGPKGLLGKIVLLVTPIYNIDGNEKFGPVAKNRPEQDGPAMVGLRPNGQGFDLNRDAIKAESPETQGLLDHVYSSWDPDVMMDLHTTDGTRHGWELTYAPPLNPNTEPDVMRFSRDTLIPFVRKELATKYKLPLFDYGNTERHNGVVSWYSFEPFGRYCTNYVGLRNRIGILSEATTYISFKDRVVATDRFVTSTLEYIVAHAKQVIDLTRNADAQVVAWGLDPAKAPALGVRFDYADRGQDTVLLEKKPAVAPDPASRPKEIDKVKMLVYDRFKSTKTEKFPAAYILPAACVEAANLLKRHGIVVERLLTNWGGPVDQFAISDMVAANNAFQGHKLIRLEGKYESVSGRGVAGDFLVRTAQPLGILIFNTLEPESLDGVAAWGFLGNSLTKTDPYPIQKTYVQVRAITERL